MGLTDEQNAEEDWGHARRELLVKEVVCFFKGCSVDMQSFSKVRKELNLHQYIDRGLQEIPLDRIRGSVGRYKDFTESFLPKKTHMRDRWKHVDVAMRKGKTPPIEVYQVADTYFVLDGNHRVSVAKQRHLDTIDAYVMEFITRVDVGEEGNFDEAFLKAERTAFLDYAGPANEEAAHAMTVTCAGCYQTLADQIEAYRVGYEHTWPHSLSYEEAFTRWHEEVYAPAVAAIREKDLLDQFPDRTETDLFIWTWQNNRLLEDPEDDSEQ